MSECLTKLKEMMINNENLCNDLRVTVKHKSLHKRITNYLSEI